MTDLPFLDWSFYDNPLRAWLLALGAAVFVFAVLSLARSLLLRQLKRLSARTTNGLDDTLTQVLKATRWWFLLALAISAGSLALQLPDSWRTAIAAATALLTLAQVGLWGGKAISCHVQRYSERKLTEDPASVTTVRALGFLLTVTLWVLVFLVALDTLGVKVTPLLTGLGIGGVAVALAVQNVLGDLFASLSIVLDKPFVYGDFIAVDTFSGTVERVGLKTTRIKSLTGEELVFSNSDLLRSRIHNYRLMQERRAVFSFGILYETPRSVVAEVPELVRETIESLSDVRFDRAHFKSFGASSLDFEVVYYVLQPDYALYMDRQQAINLALMERFAERDIEFAYPTRTLYLANAQPAANPA
ncbi:MAG TPA: mechanosensitive ion channel family protein [Longimicrobiaceae bacterium]|nr:mechanosensitive ion channel family protein [Longimicrobiaceae bacterium]